MESLFMSTQTLHIWMFLQGKIDYDATYTSLYRESDEFYQTVRRQAYNSEEATDRDAAITMVTAQLKQEIEKRKRDQSFDIYQNITF